MTDETSQPAGEPSAAAPEPATSAATEPIVAKPDEDDVPAPTLANPVAADAAAASPPVAAPPAAAPVAAPVAGAPERPAGIFVPKWVGVVAAAIIAALVFGAIGYAIGDSSSSGSSRDATSVFPGGRNRTGNGGFGNGQLPNGGQLPGGLGNGSPQIPGNSNGNSGNSNGNGNSNGSGGSGSTGGSQTASNAGFLGVAVTSADNGVTISDVQSGSPAATAGLQKGDVITAVDSTKVADPAALGAVIHAHASGDQVTVTYTRNGTSNTAKVTLTSRATAQSS